MPGSDPEPGAGQRWDPDRYARNGRFVADLGAPLIDLLAPGRGETVLDLGCGDGALTEKLARLCEKVVGVDSSAEQVEAARRRGLDARRADGHDLPFEGEFDAVFSNAALHWMTRPDAAIDGIWRALRQGGRLVGEMGGRGNVRRIREALAAAAAARGVDAEARLSWYFPSAGEYRARLEARGFRVAEIQTIDRPTRLPGDVTDWLETFAEPVLLAFGPNDREAVADEVREALRPALYDPDSGWTADYVRLRFRALKPGGRPGGREG